VAVDPTNEWVLHGFCWQSYQGNFSMFLFPIVIYVSSLEALGFGIGTFEAFARRPCSCPTSQPETFIPFHCWWRATNVKTSEVLGFGVQLKEASAFKFIV
jgi:hypothetical protein